MDEIIKFAASLSPPAAIAFAAVSAVLIWITRLGILEGRRNDPGKDVPAAQVAAVIVDPTALNRLSDQAAALNATLKDLCEIAKEKARVDTLMATELDRIREEMRIQRELERRRN
jgi:hypothetical protein